MENEWLFARCNQVQEGPNGFIDLWAREHYKSTIITFGKTIQDILINPEIKIVIFSHTRPIAKSFLRQIKRELANNAVLKLCFPEILYEDPEKKAPKWSDDDGIVVKRKSNPKESTLEAWGLVDSQPTGKHFDIGVYDDVVTKDSVTSPDMIRKTTEAWELSLNIISQNGIKRYAGTYYHFNDTYHEMIRRKAAIPRIYPATLDGTASGKSVLLHQEKLEEKRREMGSYTFSCQMLLNPLADETQNFKKEWLCYYENKNTHSMNVYIVVDSASEKKRSSDYTAVFVMGLGEDNNYYVLDMIRDRLNLKQRGDLLFELHRKWKPLKVGYEKYGMMADIEYIKDRQEMENYRFEIIELGGQVAKNDRIKRLIPVLENKRLYFPRTLNKTNYEGKVVDLVETFIEEEYKSFPVGHHDDMLDALSRIVDEKLEAKFPRLENYKKIEYNDSWIV